VSGHYVVAPDLPCDDDSAELSEHVRERYDDEVALSIRTFPGVGVRGPEAGTDAVRNPPAGAVAARGMAGRPTRALLCRDDRLFPAHFLRRVARERLAITPDEIDCGRMPALSRPKELADYLVACEAELGMKKG
jgi:hypothetical protein